MKASSYRWGGGGGVITEEGIEGLREICWDQGRKEGIGKKEVGEKGENVGLGEFCSLGWKDRKKSGRMNTKRKRELYTEVGDDGIGGREGEPGEWTL